MVMMKDNLWHINHQGGRQASNKSIFGVGPWQQYLKSSPGGSSMHLRLRPVDQDFLRSPGQLGPSGHCARLCLLSSGPSALAPDPAFRCSPISRTFTFTLRTSTLSACSPAVSSTIRPSLRLPLPCTAPRWVAAYLCPEHLRGTALTELLPFSPTGSSSFPSSHLHGHALHLSFMQCQDPPEIPDANLPVSNLHPLWYSHRKKTALRRALPLGFHALFTSHCFIFLIL